MTHTLGSLFDGSGGFPLAATLCGIEPKWAAEVEPYPIAVTRSRFPKMRHLGSVTEIHGGSIEPVDIITFGSPCQDLSVAGKRAGLKHEEHGDDETTRSGLFMEAVRIIQEMRDATDGEYPKFCLWENVPGAFSSNKGEDFRTVLEKLIQIVEPSAVMPAVPPNGWAYADSYVGDGWSLSYRVFDAQYWGVPQRRRRLYAVVDFRGECAREILFEREGLRGYFETRRESREGAPADAQNGAGADDRKGADRALCLTPWDCQSKRIFDPAGVYPTLQAMDSGGANNTAVVYSFDSLASNSMKSSNPHSGCREVDVAKTLDTSSPDPSKNQGGVAIVETLPFDTTQVTSPQNGNNPKWGDPCHPLAATGHPPTVICKTRHLFENHSQDTRYKGPLNVAPMLPAQLGTGGNNTPFVVEESTPTYSLQGNMIGRADQNGPQGDGVNEDISFTLNTIDRHAVAYAETYQRATGPLMANSHPGSYTGQDAYTDMLIVGKTPPPIQYIVRRLTPTECARLQGFPDRWGDIDPKCHLDGFTADELDFWRNVRNTHAAINGKPTRDYTEKQMLVWYNRLHTDSAEYKMWGNGIALPTALYCMQGIADALNEEDDAWML